MLSLGIYGIWQRRHLSCKNNRETPHDASALVYRFDGQRVVLFNTYNSHLGDDYVATLKDKVMARGARSFEHRHVLRGRMTRQLTPDEMLRAIDDEWFAAQPGR